MLAEQREVQARSEIITFTPDLFDVGSIGRELFPTLLNQKQRPIGYLNADLYSAYIFIDPFKTIGSQRIAGTHALRKLVSRRVFEENKSARGLMASVTTVHDFLNLPAEKIGSLRGRITSIIPEATSAIYKHISIGAEGFLYAHVFGTDVQDLGINPDLRRAEMIHSGLNHMREQGFSTEADYLVHRYGINRGFPIQNKAAGAKNDYLQTKSMNSMGKALREIYPNHQIDSF